MCNKRGISSFILHNYEPPVAAGVGGDCGGVITRQKGCQGLTAVQITNDWIFLGTPGHTSNSFDCDKTRCVFLFCFFETPWRHFHPFSWRQNCVFFQEELQTFQPNQTANVSAFYFQLTVLV